METSLKYSVSSIFATRCSKIKMEASKYISFLTRFEVRTVNYGRSFFPVHLWPKHEAREPYINGKKHSTDRENEASKIFIISLRLSGRAGKETFKLTNHSTRTN